MHNDHDDDDNDDNDYDDNDHDDNDEYDYLCKQSGGVMTVFNIGHADCCI